ncbi:hypothetical protein NEILACOT_04262 [Neisseria lactamica ATCC 23970]|uniref:Uncharacterized protein n=1 Tax=Neisseria lactamica ATCC 23970 TaxID=546265 RepID=D0W9P9_NEILA|nr:hypothetical protein NEILACOT_04262 [Neisseria lactamica ATCC 23970]EFH21807.1 hypothetical protein NEIPOLOT_02435 [Neisseria polysaccharea ATCC 43768]
MRRNESVDLFYIFQFEKMAVRQWFLKGGGIAGKISGRFGFLPFNLF